MGIDMTIPRWNMLVTKQKCVLSVVNMVSFGKRREYILADVVAPYVQDEKK